jgi:hypothetical protein
VFEVIFGNLLALRLPRFVMSAAVANLIFMGSGLKRVARPSAVLWIVFFCGAAWVASAAPGGDATAAANPPSGQVQTADLEYTEVGYSFIDRYVPVVTRSTPFPKEPAFGPGKVYRGDLRLEGGVSNSISFIWNPAAGKLYLDLNRNLDLTDDSNGVFTCREQDYSQSYQTFTNVHLPFKTLFGSRETLVDLNLNRYGSRPGCTAAGRSFWQGKVTLQDVEWQVGVVENPFDRSGSTEGSHLLLRRWAARNEPFNTYPGSSVTVPFPRKLFFQDQAWRLDCTNGPPEKNERLKLRFAAEQPALGELKITGDFIQRVVLPDGPYLVVLDQPEPVVKVPVGRYSQPGVWLKKGGAEAYASRETVSPRPQKWITVDEKKPAALTAGGPLTNSVSLSRQGKYLQLNYQLLGAGGEVYQLAQVDRSHPPAFVVYKAGRQIASDKFRYG